MKVSIQLTAWFKKYSKDKNEIIVELEATTAEVGVGVGVGANTDAVAKKGVTALDAIIAAGIPENEVGIITKDGYKISDDSLLKDGDKIKIFTTILGG
jgi:sulfur carrier protein ThiS